MKSKYRSTIFYENLAANLRCAIILKCALDFGGLIKKRKKEKERVREREKEEKRNVFLMLYWLLVEMIKCWIYWVKENDY